MHLMLTVSSTLPNTFRCHFKLNKKLFYNQTTETAQHFKYM